VLTMLTPTTLPPLFPEINAAGLFAGEPFHPPILNVEVRNAWTRMSNVFHVPLIELAPAFPMSAHKVELLGLSEPAEVSDWRAMAWPQAEVPLPAAGKSGLSIVFELMCSEPATLFWSPPMY